MAAASVPSDAGRAGKRRRQANQKPPQKKMRGSACGSTGLQRINKARAHTRASNKAPIENGEGVNKKRPRPVRLVLLVFIVAAGTACGWYIRLLDRRSPLGVVGADGGGARGGSSRSVSACSPTAPCQPRVRPCMCRCALPALCLCPCMSSIPAVSNVRSTMIGCL